MSQNTANLQITLQ